jgi:hypothetical protein
MPLLFSVPSVLTLAFAPALPAGAVVLWAKASPVNDREIAVARPIILRDMVFSLSFFFSPYVGRARAASN